MLAKVLAPVLKSCAHVAGEPALLGGTRRGVPLPLIALFGAGLGIDHMLGKLGCLWLCIGFGVGLRRGGSARRLLAEAAVIVVPLVVAGGCFPGPVWRVVVPNETLRRDPTTLRDVGRLQVDDKLWRIGLRPPGAVPSAERDEAFTLGDWSWGLRRPGVVRYNPYAVGLDSSDAEVLAALQRLVRDECGRVLSVKELEPYLEGTNKVLTPSDIPLCVGHWQALHGLSLSAEALLGMFFAGVCAASLGRSQPRTVWASEFRAASGIVTIAVSLSLWLVDELSVTRLSWFWAWMVVPPIVGWVAGWALIVPKPRAGGRVRRQLPLPALLLSPLLHVGCWVLLTLVVLDSYGASLLRTVLFALAPNLPLAVALGALLVAVPGALAWRHTAAQNATVGHGARARVDPPEERAG